MEMSRLDALPIELRELIQEHSAALTIQQTWLRYNMLGHASKPGWTKVRQHLGEHLWRLLIPYEMVRREWRQERESWLQTEMYIIEEIIWEAEKFGMWGQKHSM